MSLKTVYQNINRKTTAHIYVGQEPLDIRVPVRPPAPSEEWTRWGDDVSEESDEQSDTSLEDEYASQGVPEDDFGMADVPGVEVTNVPVLKPWKALIRVDHTVSLWEEDAENDQVRPFTIEGPGVPNNPTALWAAATAQRPTTTQPELAMSSGDTYADDPQLERDMRELSEPLLRLLSSLDPMLPYVHLDQDLARF